MKVVIVSDTRSKIVKVYGYLFDKGIDIIVHLGDVYDDATLLEDLSKKEVIYVEENNDFYVVGGEYDKVIRTSGKSIFMARGHKYNVSSGVKGLAEKSKSLNCQVRLYRHMRRYFNGKVDGV